MGQKVHPLGFRLGVYRDWDARWFAPSNKYGQYLIEDLKVRNFFKNYKPLEKAEIARIEIEKAADSIRFIITSGRPGSVIGKGGEQIEKLKRELAKLLGKQNVEVSVQEEKKPELNATLIAKSIASQIEKRASYKRTMKRAAQSSMKSGAKGIKILCSGRLQAAEIARSEGVMEGSVPLHTLRADIDYGFAEAKTTYGIIGIKVWLCRGEYQHIRNK